MVIVGAGVGDIAEASAVILTLYMVCLMAPLTWTASIISCRLRPHPPWLVFVDGPSPVIE